MRTPAILSVKSSILLAALVASCSRADNKGPTTNVRSTPAISQTTSTSSPTTTPSVQQTAAPVSRSKPLPPTGGDRPTEAEFNGYAYSYKKDGTKTVATYGEKLLPWDRDIVAEAIRDVIDRSFGDKVKSTPRLAGIGPEQTIRIDGKKHKYIVVLVTEAANEIRSLIITQLAN